MANFNSELLDKATKAVSESYEGKQMPIGDQVTVVFDDCSLLYTMESLDGGRHLRIEINVDKPIIMKGELLKLV